VKALAERPHVDTKRSIFTTMRDLLAFAAAVGYASEKRSPLSGKTNEIPFRIFETKPEVIDFMYLLALMATKNKELLRPSAENEDHVATIFEEFANGGLEIIGDWIREQPKDVDGAETLILNLQKLFFENADENGVLTGEDVKFG
jgi:dnd system-associated protein 4